MSRFHDILRRRGAILSLLLASLLAVTGCVIVVSDQAYSEGEASAFTLDVRDPKETPDGPVLGKILVTGSDSGSEGKYTCKEGKPITLRFTPSEGVTSCISQWYANIPSGMTVMKETAFELTISISDNVILSPSVAPTVKVCKVGTWSELCSAIESKSYSYVIVDTGGSLKPISGSPLSIARNVTIVGDNPYGVNGFYLKEVFIDPNNDQRQISSIVVSSDNTVTISGVTFDGGVTWKKVGDFTNTGDGLLHNIEQKMQDTLKRGDYASGPKTKVSLIRNEGTLTLGDDVIVQNAYNEYGYWEDGYYVAPTGENSKYGYGCQGAAVANRGVLTLDGAVIKDCFGIRSAAVFHQNNSTDITFSVEGNTVLTHNGGLDCSLGSVIYCRQGSFNIDGVMLTENFGSFLLAVPGNFTFSSGIISGNVAVPPQNDTTSGQANYCGVLYMYNGGSFTMNGGIIKDNITYCTEIGVKGKFNGIVFSRASSFIMNGGTICDNSIDYSLLGGSAPAKYPVECDVCFTSFGTYTSGECKVVMAGGSLESICLYNDYSLKIGHSNDSLSTVSTFDTSNTLHIFHKMYQMVSLPASSELGSNINVSVATTDGVSYSSNDMITDYSGHVYMFSCVGWTVSAANMKPLTGVPVISGEIIVGNTLTVIYNNKNVECKWYHWDSDNLIHTGFTYIVKQEDLTSKGIYVVLTGKNGYSGEVTSEILKISDNIYTVSYNIPSNTLMYIGGEEVKPSAVTNGEYTLPESLVGDGLSGYIFLGWKVTVGGSSVIHATGYTGQLSGNTLVTAILVPSSQYHATITIGTTTIAPSEPT